MKIFKPIYLCIFFCVSVSFLSGQNKKDECVFRGSISGVNDLWILVAQMDARFIVTLPADTIRITNGKFTYQRKANYPSLYFFYIPSVQVKEKIIVLAGPGEVRIDIVANDWNKYSVSGNALTNAYFNFSKKYERVYSLFNQSSEVKLPKYKKDTVNGKKLYKIVETDYCYLLKADTIKESELEAYNMARKIEGYDIRVTLREKMSTGELIIRDYGDSTELQMKRIVWKHLEINKNTQAGAIIAYQHFANNNWKNNADSAYHLLSTNAQNTLFGKSLKNYIDLNAGRKKIDFVFTDRTGQKIRLSSLKSKYTLVHFWAGWCPPCREQNKPLAALYKQYGRDRLEFINISFDETRKVWEKAIKTDSLPGYHTSELKGFDNKIGRIFNISALPSSFLLDSNGKIILSNDSYYNLADTIKSKIEKN